MLSLEKLIIFISFYTIVCSNTISQDPKTIFNQVDLNHDSFIDFDEITQSFDLIKDYLGSTNFEDLEYMFRSIDINKDQKLDYREFMRGFFDLNY
ncbi:hypothetical protein BpHYR1_029194 [Brachionus plicatilis]|uniref:EF-hand domain-containing protein n=1 Tax=Brachionus plicatilis TaxID=10195 RepID=A0A3M7Q5C5_BRAPC|nr:hypothetical protein BpHYR1_029194 [Brachionus plicatilis]